MRFGQQGNGRHSFWCKPGKDGKEMKRGTKTATWQAQGQGLPARHGVKLQFSVPSAGFWTFTSHILDSAEVFLFALHHLGGS